VSYGFSCFLVVRRDGIEYGFAAGDGTSQMTDFSADSAAARQFAAARKRLEDVGADARWIADLEPRLRRANFRFRQLWRGDVRAARVSSWRETAARLGCTVAMARRRAAITRLANFDQRPLG
jgi:hypothetical protein